MHIPVNLYPATESQSTVSANLLHKKDHSRIRYQRVSEATGKEVPAEEIVRGFEVERDNFVVISDDELKEAAPEKSAAVEIQEFVDESQIPTLYFEKPYYLEPDKGAGKAYARSARQIRQSRRRAIRAAEPRKPLRTESPGQRSDPNPAKYQDTYTEDVKKLIEDKAKGQKRQALPPKPVRSNVIDLVAALQESLAQKKPRKRGAA